MRRALPWLVGVAVLTFRGRALDLVAPSPCPGLLELTAIGAAVLRPDVALGSLLGVLQAVAIFAGSAVFVTLALLATGSLTVAVATGVAVGLGPLFPLAFAPPWEAASFAVCGIVGFLVWRGLDPRLPWRPARALSVGGALLLAALSFHGGRFSRRLEPASRRTWLRLDSGGWGAWVWDWPAPLPWGSLALGFLGLSRPDALMRSAAPYPLASCVQLRPAAGTGVTRDAISRAPRAGCSAPWRWRSRCLARSSRRVGPIDAA